MSSKLKDSAVKERKSFLDTLWKTELPTLPLSLYVPYLLCPCGCLHVHQGQIINRVVKQGQQNYRSSTCFLSKVKWKSIKLFFYTPTFHLHLQISYINTKYKV